MSSTSFSCKDEGYCKPDFWWKSEEPADFWQKYLEDNYVDCHKKADQRASFHQSKNQTAEKNSMPTDVCRLQVMLQCLLWLVADDLSWFKKNETKRNVKYKRAYF